MAGGPSPPRNPRYLSFYLLFLTTLLRSPVDLTHSEYMRLRRSERCFRMKSSLTVLLVLALVSLTGCDKGTPGGPGAGSDQKKPLYGEADNTFDLSVPSNLPLNSTTVKQGETAKVVISLKRGKNFDQDVTLKFNELPKGVTIDPAAPIIKHGETEAKLMVKVADDAATGDFTIKVTGHPSNGPDAEHDFKLAVSKK